MDITQELMENKLIHIEEDVKSISKQLAFLQEFVKSAHGSEFKDFLQRKGLLGADAARIQRFERIPYEKPQLPQQNHDLYRPQERPQQCQYRGQRRKQLPSHHMNRINLPGISISKVRNYQNGFRNNKPWRNEDLRVGDLNGNIDEEERTTTSEANRGINDATDFVAVEMGMGDDIGNKSDKSISVHGDSVDKVNKINHSTELLSSEGIQSHTSLSHNQQEEEEQQFEMYDQEFKDSTNDFQNSSNYVEIDADNVSPEDQKLFSNGDGGNFSEETDPHDGLRVVLNHDSESQSQCNEQNYNNEEHNIDRQYNMNDISPVISSVSGSNPYINDHLTNSTSSTSRLQNFQETNTNINPSGLPFSSSSSSSSMQLNFRGSLTAPVVTYQNSLPRPKPIKERPYEDAYRIVNLREGGTGRQCLICKKTYRHISTFERHMKIHTKEKPYACSKCSAAYYRRDHLVRHEKQHTKQKITLKKCIYCSFKCTGKVMLEDHMNSAHPLGQGMWDGVNGN